MKLKMCLAMFGTRTPDDSSQTTLNFAFALIFLPNLPTQMPQSQAPSRSQSLTLEEAQTRFGVKFIAGGYLPVITSPREPLPSTISFRVLIYLCLNQTRNFEYMGERGNMVRPRMLAMFLLRFYVMEANYPSYNK